MIIDKKGIVSLSNTLAECKISLFGGNIMSYRPKNEAKDVFWLGDLNKFDNIQAIRGGIPVCWPRFAEENLNDNLPRHGFARLSVWNLDKVSVDEKRIEAELSLTPEEKYGINACVKMYVKITDKFECCLETINNGDEDFFFSEALHAYFYVGNRDMVKIKGFDECQYKDSLTGKNCEMHGDLVINNEFDGAFFNHLNKIEIEDEVLNRVIIVEKNNSKSTVVWNPNKDLAEMSEGQYKNFVCVEPANQGGCYVTLKPKEKHKISIIVSVKK